MCLAQSQVALHTFWIYYEFLNSQPQEELFFFLFLLQTFFCCMAFLEEREKIVIYGKFGWFQRSTTKRNENHGIVDVDDTQAFAL